MSKAKQGNRGFPDLQIKSKNGKILFSEIKAISPYLKDGKTLRTNKHLKEQRDYHLRLQELGHIAVFATGFDECKEVIDTYLK